MMAIQTEQSRLDSIIPADSNGFRAQYGNAVRVTLNYDSNKTYYTTDRGYILEQVAAPEGDFNGYRELGIYLDGTTGKRLVNIDGVVYDYILLLANNHLDRMPGQAVSCKVNPYTHPRVSISNIGLIFN